MLHTYALQQPGNTHTDCLGNPAKFVAFHTCSPWTLPCSALHTFSPWTLPLLLSRGCAKLERLPSFLGQLKDLKILYLK